MTNAVRNALICAATAAMFAAPNTLRAQEAAQPSEPVVEKSVAISTELSGPVAPPQGNVSAYRITSPAHLTAGSFADGYLGDYVLENDLVKAVVRRPDATAINPQFPGNIVDLVNKANPVDYIEMLQVVADLETTDVQIIADSIDEPSILEATTATIVVRGHVAQVDGDTTDPAARTPLGLDVVTTYSLGRDSARVDIETAITNSTTAPVELAPGDVVNWGLASTFVEQLGMVPGEAQVETSWVAGVADDFSASYHTSGTRPLSALHTPRFSVVRGYDAGTTAPRPDQLIPRSAPDESRRSPVVPTAQEEPPMLDPTRLPSSLLPPAETNYAPPAPAPAPSPETGFGPSAERMNPRLPKGGGEADPPEGKDAGAANLTPSGRLVLLPGETHSWTRHLTVSDRDYSRLSNAAWQDKGVATGLVAGIVLEQGTDAPVPGAEIRIMGGPGWDGQFEARPVTRVVTRPNGQFALRLPAGNYVVFSAARGRTAVTPPATLTVTPGQPPVITPIIMSPVTFIRVTVVDADAPTSVPLPAKVMLKAKPGTEPVDAGFGPEIGNGVKDVFYAWRGAAHIPVTPGRYRIIVSRGIEYDIYQNDMDIVPGSHLDVPVSLKRVITPTGMVSVDAGVFTSASPVSNVSARDRVISAVCEGVSVLVSGDYDVATDLQAAVDELALGRFIKAFRGIRFLVSDGQMSGNILLYPVTEEQAAQAKAFRAEQKDVPPDVFMADLRKKFPGCIVQVDRAFDPQMGYLTSFEFDDTQLRFGDLLPPPDFDAIQVVDGKKVAMQPPMNARFSQLLMHRTSVQAGGPSLSAMGSSMSALPHGEEPGYPRVYLYTQRDTLRTFTAEDIVKAVRGHAYQVTNGPIIDVKVMNPATGRFEISPGAVVDLSTTRTLRVQTQVQAAPWVAVTGIHLNLNGLPKTQIEVPPLDRPIRYPVRTGPDADKAVVYPDGDSFFTTLVFSTRRPLDPVLPPAPQQLGGDVYPVAWTGPIFVDQDGNGLVRIEPNKPTEGLNSAPPE